MKSKMRKILFFALALLALALTACEEPEPHSDPPQPDFYGDTLDYPSLTRVDLHTSITHAQPMAGLVLFADNAKAHPEYNNAISLEFSYILPCRCVTGKAGEEIQYNWSYVDSILNDIASRNHQAVLRIRYELPGSREVDPNVPGATAVPQYIKDMEDYNESFYDNEDGDTYYADWENDELRWFTKQFIMDFANRYNFDERIAFMELGFGHWAEYHIYGTALIMGYNFPSYEYQKDFLKLVSQVLEIPWLISIDAADNNYSPIVESQELMNLPFGLFDDSFMHRNHEVADAGEEAWNEHCWMDLGYGTRWWNAPMGGEISYYTMYDQRNFLNPNGMYGHTWKEQAEKYHISFMFANNAMQGNYGTPNDYLNGSIQAGYHFKVLDVKTDRDSTVILVTNTGVAPIYRETLFSIGNIAASASLQTLLPGDTTIVMLYASLLKGKPLKLYSQYILNDQEIPFEANITANH